MPGRSPSYRIMRLWTLPRLLMTGGRVVPAEVAPGAAQRPTIIGRVRWIPAMATAAGVLIAATSALVTLYVVRTGAVDVSCCVDQIPVQKRVAMIASTRRERLPERTHTLTQPPKTDDPRAASRDRAE